MLSLAEIGPALYGAWRLAHFDADGMHHFDRSIEGFWRSFRVAVLAAPLYIVILGVNLAQMNVAGGWTRVVIAETIAYVIGWVAYPLAAFYLTRFIDRQREYVALIVALNWSVLLQLSLLMLAYVLADTGLLPSRAGFVVILAAELATLAYEWFITRTALNISGLAAAGFVFVDFVISEAVTQLAAMEAYVS